VVIAHGVHETGRREIIGLDVGEAETEAFWREFLRGLVARGLVGVMKPKPLSSLNHLTVPVGMSDLRVMCCVRGGCWKATTACWHCFAGPHGRH
jgi:hypothetical protein